jgi:hypothetical protein
MSSIPDEHHIARYCPRKHLSSQGDITGSAFLLRREKGEQNLSVNYLEFFNCPNRAIAITRVKETINLELQPGSRFAVMNVGNVKKRVLEETTDKRKLEIVHTPSQNDPSHSQISNLDPDNELIAELIVQTVIEVYSAKER